MRNRSNFSVSSRQCGGNVEKMIKRFIKKTKKERIIEEIRERQHFTKPSDVRRHKRRQAERLRAREERKKQRAQEKRNRSDK
jgi:ribosomal protein S21